MSQLDDIRTNTDNKVKPANIITRMIDTNGDGTGAFEQAIVTTQKYFIQPPDDVTYILKRMNIYAQDLAFTSADNYGAISGGLANGIKVYIENDNGVIKDFTDQMTIKTTYQWGLFAGVDATSIGGAGSDPFNVRWTFARTCGDIILVGSDNERFVVETQDSLADLDSHICQVQGCIK
jgi:hypothetical protein